MTYMNKIEEIECRLGAIEERNKRVEIDKDWERSWTRRICLILFTYLAVLLYFVAIGIESAYINAVVPAVGFLLSTLTLPLFRNLWTRLKQK